MATSRDCLVFLAGVLAVVGCSAGNGHERKAHAKSAETAQAAEAAQGVLVPPRSTQLATYPCMEQCHKDLKANTTPRELTAFHSLKKFEHGDTTFWCNFCHDTTNFDVLRLLDGRTATFDESYRLCGQCHGDKRRDWEAGIHGLQSGHFRGGERVRRACTACHDPHAPRRPTFEALPAPSMGRGAEP